MVIRLRKEGKISKKLEVRKKHILVRGTAHCFCCRSANSCLFLPLAENKTRN